MIGSKSFVDGVFQASRKRFGPKRKDGASKPRGALDEMAAFILSCGARTTPSSRLAFSRNHSGIRLF